jgi:hypothetical protein
MKLLLMWLLGVPIAVSSMVMAQSRHESQRTAKNGALSEALRIELTRPE